MMIRRPRGRPRKEPDHREAVGAWLHQHLVEEGVTHAALAAAVGVSTRTIQRAVAGDTTLVPRTQRRVEEYLLLRPKTLVRAYAEGTDPEFLDDSEIQWIAGLPRSRAVMRFLSDPRLVAAPGLRRQLIEEWRRAWRRRLVADATWIDQQVALMQVTLSGDP